jgi:hypothetical protein
VCFTIGAYDVPKAKRMERRKEKRRLAAQARRRANGAKPREHALSRTKPWLKDGISERHWRRRRKAMSEIRSHDSYLGQGHELRTSSTARAATAARGTALGPPSAGPRAQHAEHRQEEAIRGGVHPLPAPHRQNTVEERTGCPRNLSPPRHRVRPAYTTSRPSASARALAPATTRGGRRAEALMAERRKGATGSRGAGKKDFVSDRDKAVRRLSDDVLAIAQAACRQPITEDAYERLVDTGLMLQRFRVHPHMRRPTSV